MPDACSMVWAKPVRSRHGPFRPKAGMRTMMVRSLSSWMASHVMPKLSSTRGEKFSTTASERLISSKTSLRPVGLGEVEGDALLVDVDGLEDRAPLPPVVLARAAWTR